MKSFLIGSVFFFGVVLFSTPIPVRAEGFITCGKSSGPASEQVPCTVCHIIVAGNNLMKWGLGVMTVVAITVMFAMAVLYVVSAGNPGMMQQAKGGIFAALIGFGVMLSAWLIVNTVLTILVDNADDTKPLGGLVRNGAFEFSCDQSSNAKY